MVISYTISHGAAIIRLVKCKDCERKTRQRSEDGNFGKFICKCGSTKQPIVLQVVAGK